VHRARVQSLHAAGDEASEPKVPGLQRLAATAGRLLAGEQR